MLIQRDIVKKVEEYANQYPVITIVGPRQSGKTTLCKMLFQHKPYVSLENPDERAFAAEDPRGFLHRFPNGAVLDEIQRSPALVSYIQSIVDKNNKTGMYILTGSQQFELMENISQSLAGRTAIVRLLPFSVNEIYSGNPSRDLFSLLYTGFYPRIFDKGLNPTEAMGFYVNTYVERDLRTLLNVKDLSSFEVFFKLCAGRSGGVLNLTSLANNCGVSHPTIKHWISILETSYLIKLVRPYHKNFNKRLVKSPKLYFIDTGLLCYLLGITNPLQIETHPLRGEIFETFVYSELLKTRLNRGAQDDIYFFRDNTGHEIDFIFDRGQEIDAIEVKSGKTIASDFFKNLDFLEKISTINIDKYLIFNGETEHVQKATQILNWKSIGRVFS
ncbi:MAG: ATP-binding protein [Spirochaetia bacterium]